MKIKIFKKPRIFSVNKINIKDFGKIRLEQNEMISFITKTKKNMILQQKIGDFMYLLSMDV